MPPQLVPPDVGPQQGEDQDPVGPPPGPRVDLHGQAPWPGWNLVSASDEELQG